MRFALLVSVASLLMADRLLADAAHPIFATYLGGAGAEVVGSVATDSQGNIYIAGRTDSPDFPIKNAIQPVSKAFSQIFIAKFSPSGDLLYSTYLGGSANDLATSIATDPAGNVYVTGGLQSMDFPTADAFQPSSGGAVDAFVLKLDSSGKVIYATYLGGKFNDLGMAIAADFFGNAYVTGRTESPDFPVTSGVFQPAPVGYTPGYTFINAFVTKLDPAGNLVYSTYLAGTGGTNIGWGIAVNAAGEAHVAGETSALDFPVAGNALQPAPGRNTFVGSETSDAFLTKLSADGSSLIYSTYLGGPLADTSRAIALDANGDAFITGITSDARLPILGGPQPYLGGNVYLTSNDSGTTFVPQRTGLSAAEITAIAFDPTNQLVYAGTLQGVFRSGDNGITWEPTGLDPYSIASLALDPAHPGTVYAGTSFGGGVFRSGDSGATWSSANDGFPGDSRQLIFRSIAADPSGSGAFYVITGDGGEDNGSTQPVFQVTGNGSNWTLLGKGIPDTPTAVAVTPDSTVLVATLHFSAPGFFGPGIDIPGTVYRRDGNAWTPTGINDDIHAMVAIGGAVYAAGINFYRSADGGQSWTSTPLNANAVATAIAVDPNNAANIFVLAGSLLRSTDGGQSFQPVAGPSVISIAVSPLDSSLQAGTAASSDAYVVELDPNGALLYSTFIGTPNVERGEGIALDANGTPYIIGFQSPATSALVSFSLSYSGTAFVARADGTYWANLGPTTSATVLEMPSHGIAIAPDGSIVAVMIATTPGLPVQNATQTYLNGASDVYLVKFQP